MKASILFQALAALEESRRSWVQHEWNVGFYARALVAYSELKAALDAEHLDVPVEGADPGGNVGVMVGTEMKEQDHADG